MDLWRIHPDVLRRWAEEVRHLHSLWHLGPPQNRNPNPAPAHRLRPETSTAFKRKAKKKKKKNVAKPPRSDDPPTTSAGAEEVEWPIFPAADSYPPPATWNDLAPPPAPPARLPVSAEEQARADAVKAQRNGLKASEDFFSKHDSSDEDSDGDDHMSDGDEGKNGPFDFFLQLFEKDVNLREYYEKNSERGGFSCLVCGGTDVKKWKRYGNGVALLQHAKSVSKRVREHRAFARAVCQVLGWDINGRPPITTTTQEERVHKEGHIDEKENKVDGLDSVIEPSDVDKLEWPSALTRNPNPSLTSQSDLTPPPVAVAQHLVSAGQQAHPDASQLNGLKVAQNFTSEKDDLDDNMDKDAISLVQERVYEEGHYNVKENKEDQMELIGTKEIIEVSDATEQKSVRTTNNKTIPTHGLQPETTTTFKKTNKKKKKVVKCLPLLEFQDPPIETMDADQVEWPTAPAVDSNSFPPTRNNLAPSLAPPMLLPISTEEHAHMDAAKAQQNGLKASEDFFSKKDGSVNNSDGDDQGMNRHFNFFLELFEKDNDLREYYEKNHGMGGFSCLVCSGTGVKNCKKYINTVSLVQHAKSVSKRLPEHRAFARVVSEVLGYEIDRLPGPSTGEALGHSLAKSAVTAEEKDPINKNEDIQKVISDNCNHEDIAGSSGNMTSVSLPPSESCSHEDVAGYSEDMTTVSLQNPSESCSHEDVAGYSEDMTTNDKCENNIVE